MSSAIAKWVVRTPKNPVIVKREISNFSELVKIRPTKTQDFQSRVRHYFAI
ncbi:MAC/perforin domain-containing protein [Aerosakkonema funiforme]|uniref:MAC/perforin domain-containing protein n=1 Tax=Aerosakkonema funiforme TaxID=1246630 RepID=UPI0035B8A078